MKTETGTHQQDQRPPNDAPASLAGTPDSAWISVKERLPENDEYVIHAYADCRPIMIGRHSYGRFFDGNGPGSYPTKHWMPVPSLPNDASQTAAPTTTQPPQAGQPSGLSGIAGSVSVTYKELERALKEIKSGAGDVASADPPAGYEELDPESGALRIADASFDQGLNVMETCLLNWLYDKLQETSPNRTDQPAGENPATKGK